MIEIRRLTPQTANLLWTVEDRRLDSERVIVRPKGTGFALEYKPMPGALWRVGGAPPGVPDDAESWLEDPDRDVFLAWLEGGLAGQILVEVYENNLARVRDIRVELSKRRRGIGGALVQMAEDWARGRGLGGLTCETQDANAGACQFLTRCGFELGGVDTLRYVARSQQLLKAAGLRENALVFYRFFR